MANIIQKIRTTTGDASIDYHTLENKPISDKSLSEENGFADAAAVGARLRPLEEALKDVSNGETTTSNIVTRVTDLETKTSETKNEHGERLTEIEKVISGNGFTTSSHIVERVTDIEKTIGSDAFTVTDWDTALETGWYENSDSSQVKNTPVSDPNYRTYGQTVKNKYQIVYIVKDDFFRRFERYGINQDWIETTPVTQEISVDDFKKILTDINNNEG